MKDKISERRLQRITKIIDNYDCSKSLHLYLKDFFKSHPEMGSTDRRIATTAVYNFFRLGKSLTSMSMQERITIASFIMGSYTSPFTEFLFRNYTFFPQDEITFSPERKLELVQLRYPELKFENVFPFKEHISPGLDFEKFVKGLFVQPKVWIRIRDNYQSQVIEELKEKNISFEKSDGVPNALGFENNTKLTELNSFKNGYFEIQDLSSQKTVNFMSAEAGEDWWDCCAGAGGKSLMLMDRYPGVKLFATDIRDSIFINLEIRFKRAGIKNYKTKVIDLENDDLSPDILFDGIICDVPCSGSGTWGRTPESMSCFDEKTIFEYQNKQKQIALKAAGHLKANGKFVYITCSVFKEENEEVSEYILQNTKLKHQQSQLINGSELRADSLFVAVFVNTTGH